jgi:hypothetical protein
MTSSHSIGSCQELRGVYAEPGDLAVRKEIDRLDHYCQEFIRLAPFVVLGSAGDDDFCDVSPRGDRPGFVQVLDEHTLAIPDRPGNNRLDTIQNLLARPQIGLLFMIPGFDETLRVRGHGRISTEAALLERAEVDGKRPRAALVVAVKSAFYHCGKAMKRSRLWDPGSWPARTALPTFGKILAAQIRGESADKLDERIADSYRTRLY